MKTLMFAALAFGAFAAAPTLAETVDPETVLTDLRYDGRWHESRSRWDGHVGRPKARWEWEMKVTYSITPKGRMANCNVVAPSGSAAFDNAACSKLVRESRFEPKRDAAGKAVRSKGELTYQLYSMPGMICGTGLDELEE